MTDEDYLREFFGEPISIYTDADALSDGTLIDIAALNLTFESRLVNRITGNLFWTVQPHYPLNDEQLEKLFANCDDDEEPVNFDHQTFALDFEQRLKQATGEGRIRNIKPDMWLVENELGGWTLMNPSDY